MRSVAWSFLYQIFFFGNTNIKLGFIAPPPPSYQISQYEIFTDPLLGGWGKKASSPPPPYVTCVHPLGPQMITVILQKQVGDILGIVQWAEQVSNENEPQGKVAQCWQLKQSSSIPLNPPPYIVMCSLPTTSLKHIPSTQLCCLA